MPTHETILRQELRIAAEIEVSQKKRIALLEGLLREWLDGEYDGQDYLRRVRLALHQGAPVAALGEG